MRNQASREFRVDLRHAGGYRFSSQASEGDRLHGEPFASDEPDPVGEASAPATPALLGSAIGHCLSASLIESLRHAHVDMTDCTTEVVSVVEPNSEGLPRIRHVDVVIRPKLAAPNPRTQRCADVFEKHCTVTASVREGIDVRVRVDWEYSDAAGNGVSARSAAAAVVPG